MTILKFNRKPVIMILSLLVILTVNSCTQTPATRISPPVASGTTTRPASSSVPIPSVPAYTYKIVRTYPHDNGAFTEGLVYDKGVLFESTGRYRSSSLRRVELETGRVLQIYDLPALYFGEGLALYQKKLIQLTWQSHIGFVYDQETFAKIRDFTYPTEGWGLTQDGVHLIMSDGTSTLHFLNPETYEETSSIEVKDQGTPVTYLNELEFIKDQIYANIWQTAKIAIINPQSGAVVSWIDLTGIIKPEDYKGQIDVLNGIAYDAQADRLFVTGKLWPLLFEIKLN